MRRRVFIFVAVLAGFVEPTIVSSPVLAQSICACRCFYVDGKRVCRRVCSGQPLFTEYRSRDRSSAPTVSSITTAGTNGFPFALLFTVSGAILLIHYLRKLAAATVPASLPGQAPAQTAPLPFWSRWGSRKFAKLEKDTAFSRANTQLIIAKLDEANARREFARLMAELTVSADVPPSPTASAAAENSALSLAELEQLINSMHELDLEQRAQLLRLLALHLEEKRA